MAVEKGGVVYVWKYQPPWATNINFDWQWVVWYEWMSEPFNHRNCVSCGRFSDWEMASMVAQQMKEYFDAVRIESRTAKLVPVVP